MYFAYETDVGTFVLERQAFTESAWQFLFNGKFIDTYGSPDQGAEDIARHGTRLGVSDAVLLPPATLSAWEVHWAKGRQVDDACELWLHRAYAQGRQAGRLA